MVEGGGMAGAEDAGGTAGESAGMGGVPSGGASEGGSAGEPSPACVTARDTLAKLLADAQACNPLVINPDILCTGEVEDECGCPRVVNNQDSQETSDYVDAVDRYLEGCRPCFVRCRALPDDPMCTGANSNGSCAPPVIAVQQ